MIQTPESGLADDLVVLGGGPERSKWAERVVADETSMRPAEALVSDSAGAGASFGAESNRASSL